MKDKILVPCGIGYANAVTGLGHTTDNIADFYINTNDFKLILFTGGADVSPELYNDTSPRGLCSTNEVRDKIEAAIFVKAIEHNIPMTGICRGAQFINVMSGGTMMHDINGHSFKYHKFRCSKDDKTITVNSLHHQMIIPPGDGYAIGWCPKKLSSAYYGYKDKQVEFNDYEVEAVLIPRTMCCGVQYHPEGMSGNSDGYQWYYNMVKDLINMNMDSFVDRYTGGKKHAAA